jgi:branched-chain amino acid transport system ATP-binding protein
MIILHASDLRVSFGGVHAVKGVTIELVAGQLVGLIGPNGAGKTTIIDALSGFVSSSGEIAFDGRRIDHLPAFRRSRLGLTRTFQTIELFDDLTVLENLQIAASRPAWWAFLLDALNLSRQREDSLIHDALELLDLSALTHKKPRDISLGEQKRIAVARALASSPRLLLLDEPAAGLDSEESLELGRHLRRVCDSGVTILLVDHDMGLVLGISDYVYVLDAGELLSAGTPAEVRRDKKVVAAYLGTTSTPASDGSDLGGPGR